MSSIVQNGKYIATSASQVKSYTLCPRKWFNESVLGLRPPQTPAQKFGTEVHGAIEDYLVRNKDSKDERLKLFVEAAAPYLPAKAYVERYIELDTYTGGRKWRGYIDVLSDDEDFKIIDHKTISDFRYCKTPLDLQEDIQMVSYAKWVLDIHFPTHWKYPKPVEQKIAHLYLLTKNKNPKARFVETSITRDKVNEVWNKKLEIVKEMSAVVDALCKDDKDRSEEVAPSLAACDAYGGCPFRVKCGINKESITRIVNAGKKKTEMGMSLSEKLAAKKKEGDGTSDFVTTGSTRAPIVMSTSKEPVDLENLKEVVYNIVPPDAPKEDPVLSLAEVMDNPKRGRKKKGELEVVSDNARGSFDLKDFKPVEVPAALQRKKLALYVDCIPLKGADRANYVTLDTWLAPIVQEVAEMNGVADWRLIQYTSKPVLAVALRSKLETLPETMLISSYSAGADVALEVLAPLATELVRALK